MTITYSYSSVSYKKVQSTKNVKSIFQKKDFITCSNTIINEPQRFPIRLDNVFFANNEQASIVFFIAHAEHNLIKLNCMFLSCHVRVSE